MASAASELCVVAAAAAKCCVRVTEKQHISVLHSAGGSGATIRRTKEQSPFNSSNNVWLQFCNDEKETRVWILSYFG